MSTTQLLYLLVIALALSVAHNKAAAVDNELVDDDSDGQDWKDDDPINRTSFPADFQFGAGTSAYQIEGAAYKYGKGPSIWDNFTAEHPEKIRGGGNGNVADDSYHRFKEDVKKIKDMGLTSYRFSIAWTRILPHGKKSKGKNDKGIEYYKNLTDEILAQGLTPFATLFHWDLPQALEDEYKGFLNKKIVNDFRDYAELCFHLFGDKIKHWVTINEPWSYSVTGYARGAFPPNRCSKRDKNVTNEFLIGRFASFGNDGCVEGDSGREPYNVSHNLILAHAAAVQVYKEKFQKTQKGEIGITLNIDWMIPYNKKSQEDHDAVDRGIIFNYGWFIEPLHAGAYPIEMVARVGDRLPKFTAEESHLVQGSYDFIGINYYTTRYAIGVPCMGFGNPSYLTDPCVTVTNKKDGKCIGMQAASEWLCSYPEGLREILLRTKYKYDDPVIYITENGFDGRKSYKLRDWRREKYHRDHLKVLRDAIKIDKVRVKGYFVWSLLDNFEWLYGYSVRFGMIYINYDEGPDYLSRTYKNTSHWFQKFMEPWVLNG